MGEDIVAVTALGVLGSSVGLMAWVVKKILGDIAPALREHAETAGKLATMVDRNTEQSKLSAAKEDEILQFMKRLNGKLEHAVIQKVTEQNVMHQTVEHMEQS